MEKVCRSIGYSRVGYYKRLRIENRRESEEERILWYVNIYRSRQPLVGVRKIQVMLRNNGIRVGRDRLFLIIRKAGLLVKRRRSYSKTTNSYHRFRVYKNLINGKKIERPNQVYLADITYLRTKEGYGYLSLITDKYSRKIVGYNLSRSLALEGSLKALRMATKFIKAKSDIVHHSDRGIQYCSNLYTNKLKSLGIKISMTEDNHVYENALAERVNGIIKNELLFGTEYLNFDQVRKMVDQAIHIYNNERLHLSLNFKTPAVVHAG